MAISNQSQRPFRIMLNNVKYQNTWPTERVCIEDIYQNIDLYYSNFEYEFGILNFCFMNKN